MSVPAGGGHEVVPSRAAWVLQARVLRGRAFSSAGPAAASPSARTISGRCGSCLGVRSTGPAAPVAAGQAPEPHGAEPRALCPDTSRQPPEQHPQPGETRSVQRDGDFVIELDGQPGRYRLHVSSPAGEDSADIGLDPNRLGVDLGMLQAQVLASATTSRTTSVPELERPLRQVGQALYPGIAGKSHRTL
jgi:hypothetical protein